MKVAYLLEYQYLVWRDLPDSGPRVVMEAVQDIRMAGSVISGNSVCLGLSCCAGALLVISRFLKVCMDSNMS